MENDRYDKQYDRYDASVWEWVVCIQNADANNQCRNYQKACQAESSTGNAKNEKAQRDNAQY
jgi:hypothetical protein